MRNHGVSVLCVGWVWLFTTIPAQAEPPEVDLRTEISEVRKLAGQLVQRLDELEAKLDGVELRTKPLKPSFDSPQETFATFRHAHAQLNWLVVADCHSANARDNLAKALLLGAPLAAGFIENEFEQDSFNQKFDKLLSKYLPDETKAKSREKKKSILLGSPEMERELTEMVKKIKDRRAFVADVLALLTSVKGGEPKDVLLDRLVDVKIEGDVAKGRLDRPGAAGREIVFRKSDGDWRIEEYP